MCISSMENKLPFPDSNFIKPSDDPLGKEKKTRLKFFNSSEGDLKDSEQFFCEQKCAKRSGNKKSAGVQSLVVMNVP